MGNKDNGRAVNNLEFLEYIKAHGGMIGNTGISFTNFECWKYFRLLRDYFLNRIEWISPQIPQIELRLIEWNIFHIGFCAMVRPVIIKNNVKYKLPEPKIYQCVYTELNRRTGEPTKINLTNVENKNITLQTEYNSNDFVIFTDEFLFANQSNPFCHIAWEYACKMHELDLMFNANSHKLRMPLVFNNASIQTDEKGKKIMNHQDIGISEIIRSAIGRNEQYVEIPQNMVGSNFLHEPQYIDNDIVKYIEAHKKLLESYMELLGLYTNREKSGVYTVKDLQVNGDETGEYITETIKTTRVMRAKEAVNKFQIDLRIQVI